MSFNFIFRAQRCIADRDSQLVLYMINYIVENTLRRYRPRPLESHHVVFDNFDFPVLVSKGIFVVFVAGALP